MTRSTFLMFGAAAMLRGQSSHGLGLFDEHSDIGNPDIKGAATYDPAAKQYRLTGAGENMWAKTDQFHFAWKKIVGNVRITATVHFVGTCVTGHRKAGIMLRKSLDPGAPYVDAVVHGDGLTVLQFREMLADVTRGFRFPVVAPVRIALERRGNGFSMWQGREGGPVRELGSVAVPIMGELYAGLFICSHNPKSSESAIFSDVGVETLAGNP